VFRTLIVDDEPIARQVLREELDPLDDVSIIGEAENGAVAEDLIQRLTPDLVFLDLQMPELGGIEVIGSVSARRLPAIIVVSACEDSSRKALRAGAVDYLLKPVNPSCLRRAIERLQQIPSICGDAAYSDAKPRGVEPAVGSEF
jgi:two-component system LytT family response regulator